MFYKKGEFKGFHIPYILIITIHKFLGYIYMNDLFKRNKT